MKLYEQRDKLNARIKQAKAKISTQKRKEETRKKILLGALMMEMIDQGELSQEQIWNRLDSFLTREIDRKLFELTPWQKEENEQIDKQTTKRKD